MGYISSALKATSSKQLLGVLKSMDKALSDILGKASQKFVGGAKEGEEEKKKERFRINKTAMEGMFPEGMAVIPSLVSTVLTPSYHYLAQRPTLVERAASVGLRQLSYDLIESFVEMTKKNPSLNEREKKRLKKLEDDKEGHSTAILRQEERIMNEKPTVKEFFNETLKEAYGKVLKVLDNDKRLTNYFFDHNPDIKTAKRGLEARAVEWALDPANREYWGTNPHPTLSKMKLVSEKEGKETISARRKKAVASKLLPILKGKVATTKARREAEAKEKARKEAEAEEAEKAKPAPKKKAKKGKKEEEADEDELFRVATELAESEKGAVKERKLNEFIKLFEDGAKNLIKMTIQQRANDEPADTKKSFDDVRDEGYAKLTSDSEFGLREGTNLVLKDWMGRKTPEVSGFLKEMGVEERNALRAKLEKILLDTYKNFDTKGMKRVITRYVF